MIKFLEKTLLSFFFLLLGLYRYLFKTVLVIEGCRHKPTCSCYMHQALKLHGPFKGLLLGLKRLGTCHPWGGVRALYDPVPPKILPLRKDT